jgi:ribosome production factor 1
MGPRKAKLSSKAALPFKTANKHKRQDLFVKQKRARDKTKRDERYRRKREEDKDPSLKEERLRQNVPLTLERKRVWDEVDGSDENELGLSVDTEQLKRRRVEEATAGTNGPESESEQGEGYSQVKGGEDDHDSMLDSSSEDEDADEGQRSRIKHNVKLSNGERQTGSPSAISESTHLDLTPESLLLKFPTLFAPDPPPAPKILITTSINSTLHNEAEILTGLFPHSVYIRRSAHRYGHKFSVREIASFASNRNFTALLVLKEDQKKPTGLDITHLPHGPTFHFSISNWVEGKKLPGHGKPTGHSPELILNNFRTPLGLLTARLFRTLYPPQPELQGRQVVTLHNQRDYLFLRRHRYVFREKRATEKNVVGPDGKEVKGVEGIRAGLQELGPRFTLKLRRVDKYIGKGVEPDGVQWEWKGGMEKQRTKFQL